VSAPALHAATFEKLSARTFHDMVRLRVDTFIVEQSCSYHELDGRDILPSTEHLWVEEDGGVVSYLRMYPGDEQATWIGRVVTAPTHRGRGLGGLLQQCSLASDVVAVVPESRLASSPLISLDPEDRVRHTTGQSLPDWIALRSGRLPSIPDGVALMPEERRKYAGRPMPHVEARDIVTDVLRFGLGQISDTLPVYLLLREYQSELLTPASDLGFQPIGEQVLMVKQTTVAVRRPSLIPVLEAVPEPRASIPTISSLSEDAR